MSNLTQWDILFYNSVFVILYTQIFSISCQLLLGLIPQTIRMHFYAVLVLCQESRERGEPSSRLSIKMKAISFLVSANLATRMVSKVIYLM